MDSSEPQTYSQTLEPHQLRRGTFKQKLQNIQMILCRCQVYCSTSIFIKHVYQCRPTTLNKNTNTRCLAIEGSSMKWGPSPLIGEIWSRTLTQQKTDFPCMAKESSLMKRSGF